MRALYCPAACAALAVAAVACSHTISRQQANAGPQELYALAVEEIEGAAIEEAIADLQELRARYPYSRFSTLAELRIADAQMRRGRHIEAIEGFRSFLRLHPNHDQAEYALLQIAEGYRAQLPNDWPLLPPVAERDQVATHEAIAAYDALLERFPGGATTERARQERDGCRLRLARHELYVAHFYLRAGHPESVCGRALGLVEHFGGLGLDQEALQLCLQARLRLGDAAGAQQVRQRMAAPAAL